MTAIRPNENAEVFALVSNIPNSFHSQDLRNYFSQFVEERRFKCFHFRNRPEQRLHKPTDSQSDRVDNIGSEPVKEYCGRTNSNVTVHSVGSKHEGLSKADLPGENKRKVNRKCCVIKIAQKNLKKALQLYHKKPWVDRSGNAMGVRCYIVGIKLAGPKTPIDAGTAMPLSASFTKEDLTKLPELNPPDIMPHGNVGTPTPTYLQLIRDCKIPPSVIKKLGLSFPKRRSNRKYGNVPFEYGTDVISGDESIDDVAVTGTGRAIYDRDGDSDEETGSTNDVKESVREGEGEHSDKGKKGSGDESSESGEDDDDDTCEEWERYESLHDDVTKQNRTEERLFEEEMEIVWDKGSSGLVFYTDAAYWDAMKGDFDERTSDDWDVDMSIFSEKDGGTKDAKDWLQMQREARIRRGEEDTSVFTKKQIGQFENHTKGVGRQLMSHMGWREGDGLGRSKSGITNALENEGQTSKDKRGFGYRGEKLCRYPVKKKQKTVATISTAYDDPNEIDPPTSVLRRNDPAYLKHRDEII